MRCLIYQFYNGDIPQGAKASKDNIGAYADRIGVDHVFFRNDNYTEPMGVDARYFDALRPVYDDSFNSYDRVLFLDMDIYAVDGLKENIFEQDVGHIGMCEEVDQPAERYSKTGEISGSNDERWANLIAEQFGSTQLRNAEGQLRVFNSGVILWTRAGLQKAREVFVHPRQWWTALKASGLPRFYWLDQNYFGAMTGLADIKLTELSPEWDRQLYYIGPRSMADRPVYDQRTQETKFVHVQLSGKGGYSADKLHRIVNYPQSEWS